MEHTSFFGTRLAAVLAAAMMTAEVRAGEFDLAWHSIDCGGSVSSGTGGAGGGGFELAGTIGQPDAGRMSAASFDLTGGFWAGGVTPIGLCPADINGDGYVDVNDLLAVVGQWGPCPNNCPADIAPSGPGGGGDGVVDVNDLLAVIGAWGACP